MQTSPPFYDALALQTLRLQGFRSRHIHTSAGRVHVLECEGSGTLPPLVLLHGFSSAGVHFHALLSSLRKRSRRVVVPDLLAHGFSDVPRRDLTIQAMERALIEALDAVIDEPAVLFGLSMGGAAALRYALARPSKVRALMLCSPGGAAMQPEELDCLRKSFEMNGHADALAFVDRVFAQKTVLRQAYAWALRKSFARPVMQSLLASLRCEDLFQPSELASLTMPIRLVWGARDRVLPDSSRQFFRRYLPAHTRIEEPEGFGHSPFLDDPRGLARRIESFLREVSRPSLIKTDRDAASQLSQAISSSPDALPLRRAG